MLLVERLDDVTYLAALVGQLDTNRAPVDTRTLVIEERHLHQLLEVVRNVRAEIVAARTQLTGRQFLVADVVEQQRLHRIDIGATTPIEFILDNVKQTAMSPLD